MNEELKIKNSPEFSISNAVRCDAEQTLNSSHVGCFHLSLPKTVSIHNFFFHKLTFIVNFFSFQTGRNPTATHSCIGCFF